MHSADAGTGGDGRLGEAIADIDEEDFSHVAEVGKTRAVRTRRVGLGCAERHLGEELSKRARGLRSRWIAMVSEKDRPAREV